MPRFVIGSEILRHFLNQSIFSKREGNWAELAFAKTSGIVTGHAPVCNWPIFSLSQVAVPEVFAKVNSAPSPRFLSGVWVDLHWFQKRFVIGWENNRDGDVTIPLSLKRIGMN